jgi:hypothetical protein
MTVMGYFLACSAIVSAAIGSDAVDSVLVEDFNLEGDSIA